jgi:hypothetical protein
MLIKGILYSLNPVQERKVRYLHLEHYEVTSSLVYLTRIADVESRREWEFGYRRNNGITPTRHGCGDYINLISTTVCVSIFYFKGLSEINLSELIYLWLMLLQIVSINFYL